MINKILSCIGLKHCLIVKISPQIRKDTGWYSHFQFAYNVYNFYKSKKGYIDLYGKDGALLRTMSAQDYFHIVSLHKKNIQEDLLI